ncbi:hypothetical protein BLI708_04480 [Bifidobacterium imperatoris]|uniref:Uncharacterized protein n=1 Tax=Bifidobacterium imperatoris TaxID=2020965 RepID=A0A2N5IP59_9BIFI|nr:hypothetical protein [Bifidobacterium imperatoris]PLS23751.1 hypothetical protein Tam1G_2195 [Bifidobacterium imperatoris]QSY58529.1 hypothetical protein BLI708_04480 [Bifidobacterium imperatoris]
MDEELPQGSGDDAQVLRVIEDEQGLLILGENKQIDSWLASVGIDATNTRELKKQSLQKASHAAQALGEAMASDGRWVKMTEESAKLVKQYGSNGTGVVRNKGRIVAYLKFENLSQLKSLANPQMVTGAAGIMAQMALEQAAEEITDYLKAIDKKVDALIQDQKDQIGSGLEGDADLIEETLEIRGKVGLITETTWSKLANCPRGLATAQSYALRKLENIANELHEASGVADVRDVAQRLHKDAADWLGFLAVTIQLQDKVSVLELERVLIERPDTVEQYRQGLQAARRRRLHNVENRLIQLNDSIAESAELVRQPTCLTFFERVGCGGASSGMSANGIGPVWLVLWKTGSAWRRSGRSP